MLYGIASMTLNFYQNIGNKSFKWKIKADIGIMLGKICEYKGVEILDAEAYPNPIHILASVSSFMV